MPRVGECLRPTTGGCVEVAWSVSDRTSANSGLPRLRATSLGTGSPTGELAGGETTSIALRGLAGRGKIASVAIVSSSTGLGARGGSSAATRARAWVGSMSAAAPLHTQPNLGATSISTVTLRAVRTRQAIRNRTRRRTISARSALRRGQLSSPSSDFRSPRLPPLGAGCPRIAHHSLIFTRPRRGTAWAKGRSSS